MNTLVFLLEEPSAREMLQGFLPKLIPPGVDIRYVVFEGKNDMGEQLVGKLRGWRKPDTAFVILRDKDSGDCLEVKKELVTRCQQGAKPETLVRIACHEIESWYLGDLAAVEAGLGVRGLAAQQTKAKYRNPDHLGNAKQELIRLTGGVYQEIGGSRVIGKHLRTDGNRSHSFVAFVVGLRRILQPAPGA
jgi:hypothetical protein